MGELVANFRQIIAVNRNLGFFTTGYNYLVQIIPALIVAPMFIRGEVEFGVITQSAIAFVQLLGAFSLIVTQFQSISSLAAVIARLGTLWEAIEKAQSTSAARIQMREDADGTLVYKGLTLRSPRDGRTLVKDLSLTVPRGKCLFISGPNERAKVALFRATAGIWDAGEGCIVRPGLDRMLLLPERPYLPPGTLREALLRAPGERVSDESILSAVHTLDLDRVVERAGGLDAERDWDGVLSLGEQQLLAFAHLLIAHPQLAFFDRPATALTATQVRMILNLLSEQGISYLTIGDGDDSETLGKYDAVLELQDDGSWSVKVQEDIGPGNEQSV
jgi:putative ATP-binding cassette transporter